MWFVELVNIN